MGSKQQAQQEVAEWQQALARVKKMPRSIVWGVRAVFLLLVVGWIAGAMYLSNVVRTDEAEIQRITEETQQQELRARRAEALNRAAQQQQQAPSSSQNVVDAYRR